MKNFQFFTPNSHTIKLLLAYLIGFIPYDITYKEHFSSVNTGSDCREGLNIVAKIMRAYAQVQSSADNPMFFL
ncbi:MAG: hypothetical protein IJP61_09760 [Treponema sp.]|nr:hypothetical protein [Treponema sp.]